MLQGPGVGAQHRGKGPGQRPVGGGERQSPVMRKASWAESHVKPVTFAVSALIWQAGLVPFSGNRCTPIGKGVILDMVRLRDNNFGRAGGFASRGSGCRPEELSFRLLGDRGFERSRSLKSNGTLAKRGSRGGDRFCMVKGKQNAFLLRGKGACISNAGGPCQNIRAPGSKKGFGKKEERPGVGVNPPTLTPSGPGGELMGGSGDDEPD